MPLIFKSVKKSHEPAPEILRMMQVFRSMVNDCIRIGLTNDVSSMKRLSRLSYKETGKYNIVNYYRLCAISHAAGILANRKKSIKRGYSTKDPYVKKILLISCYNFKIDRDNGILQIPIDNRQYHQIRLNKHVRITLSDPSLRIRSFVVSSDSLSICYSKEVRNICPSLSLE